jgi:hypothetical protein
MSRCQHGIISPLEPCDKKAVVFVTTHFGQEIAVCRQHSRPIDRFKAWELIAFRKAAAKQRDKP